MQWYYLDDQRQQSETDEDSLRRMAEAGELRPETLVWNDSMTEWIPLNRALSGKPLSRALADETGIQINPYQAPLGGGRGASSVRALAAILAQHAGWTRFLGIVTILFGVISVPLGIFYIWMGSVLFQIAAQAEEAKHSGSERALTEMLEKAALYFKANAIFILVIMILGFVLMGAAVVLGLLAALAPGGSIQFGLP